MGVKLKFKGRTFSSGRSLAQAMEREAKKEIEKQVRRAASSAGASVRKTSKGLEVTADHERMERFRKRLDRS